MKHILNFYLFFIFFTRNHSKQIKPTMEHKVNMPRPIDSECISKKCHPVNKTSVFGMMDHQPPMSPLGPSPLSSPVGLEMKCHITYKMVKRNLGLHIAWERQVVACPEHNWLTSPSWAAQLGQGHKEANLGQNLVPLATSVQECGSR